MIHQDDERLVSQCVSGDDDAWKRFMAAYTDSMYASVRAVLSRFGLNYDTALAEDIFGDTITLLLEDGCRRLRAFEGRNGSSLKSYLWVVAARCATDRLRKERLSLASVPDPDSEFTQIADGGPSHEQRLIDRQREDAVRAALAGLPADDRMFLAMCCNDCLTIEQIAVKLGIPPGTAYSRKSRLIEKIRQNLCKESGQASV